MIATTELYGLSLTELVIAVGILGYLLRELADFRGWSRSSRLLRTENEDLARRNKDLEETVARHEITLTANDVSIALLEQSIRDLEKRDQAAVLDQLKVVEEKADSRHLETIGVLAQIAENTSQPIHTTTEGATS